jgi:RNA polymerase sigma-70 factor (ECF subfamily)
MVPIESLVPRAHHAGLPSDSELAARAADGDGAAFAAIMRRHNRLLFRTARSILRSDAEAEDAMQDAYLRAWRALHGFRSEAKLSTWLARIVINESLARLRSGRRAAVEALDAADAARFDHAPQQPPDDAADRQPEGMAMRAEARRLLEASIDRLPDGFRSVFILRAVEEMSVEDVAAALGLPAVTVRTRLFRARLLLRHHLARHVDPAVGDAFSFDGERCHRMVTRVLRAAGVDADVEPEVAEVAFSA